MVVESMAQVSDGDTWREWEAWLLPSSLPCLESQAAYLHTFKLPINLNTDWS